MRLRTMAVVAVLAMLSAACGDGNDNDHDGGNAVPTPIVTAPPQIPCPEQITYTVMSEGSDLDVGWTGIFHDQLLGDGGSLSFALDCAGSFLGQCGDCVLTGPIASTTIVDNHRCLDATQTRCASDADCGGSACVFFFGAPLPIGGGGIPICVTNRVVGPVTGIVRPELGQGTSDIVIVFTNFTGLSIEQPCPVCSGARVGAAGTCEGGTRNGQPCTTDGTTDFFGNTSFDCPPNAGADIGSSNLPLNLTTGTRELAATETCLTGGAGAPCYCAEQVQPNQCTDGICAVDTSGQGVCEAGPIDLVCAIETFRGCESNADCPAPGDSCSTKTRSCIGPTDAEGRLTGPIVRTGKPSQTVPLQVATFCLDRTRNGSVNGAAGFPGPGGLLLPTAACIKPSCP